MRYLTTLADLIGAAAVTYGVAMFSVPVAFIVGGAFVLVGSYVAAAGDRDVAPAEDEDEA